MNYDGAKKTRTTIGDRAFIGCNSNLIAPVTIEPEAYVAAGSTITKTVPGGALAVARAQQRVIEGWRKKRFGDGGSRVVEREGASQCVESSATSDTVTARRT